MYFSVNDQLPKEILEHHRYLLIDRESLAVNTVDKLYVNGQLFQDQEITPWLYWLVWVEEASGLLLGCCWGLGELAGLSDRPL